MPPKKSNTLVIVLAIIGVVFVLLLGTCAAAGYLLKRKTAELAENIADGGMVLVAPPEVKAELEGAKKDYVGSWTSTSGKSTLDIDADGNVKLVKDEGGMKETITMPIAAFRGNDIEMKAVVTFRIDVPEPPHREGSTWKMRAKGISWRR
jgi:hypothetical protein